MRKILKNLLPVAICCLPFFLFLIQISPASAAEGWQVGYNLARDGSSLPENELKTVIFAFLQWLLLIFTFVSVIAFVLAGMMFLTAGGDTQKVTTAKNYVTYATIGIAVGLSGYIVITFINALMSGKVQLQS